jgi:cytochrome c biogenesis protein CcmG, thiol:disulfide interchange protein DsbE
MGYRSRLLRALLAGAIGIVLVLAWTQRNKFAPLDVGSRAPQYDGMTLSGQPFSIEASRGKVVVLNIWATWCLPCRKEMPALQRLHDQLGARGLYVVGISTDVAETRDVADFVKGLGITFPIVHDTRHTIEDLYSVPGLPTTFVIDKKGRIDRKLLGAREWDDRKYVEYFEKLLSE